MDPKMVLEGDEVALDGAEVDHLAQEGQGDEGCHVEISEEGCVGELPVAECLEETRPEGPRPVGADHPLLQPEEGPLAAPGHLRAERKGCSLPQPCPIKQVLQGHSPNLNLTMNMVHMRSLMLSLPMRDMIAITVSSLLQRNDTEYYDYGHGEAQDPSYESYGQGEWDSSWSGSGAGGKVPPTRQSKGSYREHPY
ncbi:hypothetical protein CCH79_00004606, partial [Gambusia affinis]